MVPPRPAALRERRTSLRPFALACVLLCGSGCAFALVRPYPRDGQCNTLFTPLLDAAGLALSTAIAREDNSASIRADCAEDDNTCYRHLAHRQSDVRAEAFIAAAYAASAAWGLWARSQCREALAALPPPVIPTDTGPASQP